MGDKIYLACYNVFDSGSEKQKIVFASFSEEKVKKWVDDFNNTSRRYSDNINSQDHVSRAYYLEIEIE